MSAQPQRSFSCPACEGTVYIPHNLPPTTAPCPHCGNLITSPSLANSEQHPTASFSPTSATPTAATPTRVRSVEPAPERQIPADRQISPVAVPVRRKSTASIWFISIFLLLALLGGAYFLYTKTREARGRGTPGKYSTAKPAEKSTEKSSQRVDASSAQSQYYREGWKKEAAETLSKFIAARTPEEKANYVIGGRETLVRVRKLYGNALIDELDTPADAFVPVPLREEDITRNIFLMAYDRPAQFAMNRFFKPLASIEVLYEVEQQDQLTQTATDVSNYSMEPLKIQAYFKKNEKGMMLDWDVYLQTRHRTFKKFFDDAKPGNTGVFRVLIVENVPLASEKARQLVVYRIGDPAHMTDSYRMTMPNGSQRAKMLEQINWRGSKSEGPSVSTATVELSVNDAHQPQISRLVCWEFEGLGGGATAADTSKGTDKIAKPDSLEDDVHSVAPISE